MGRPAKEMVDQVIAHIVNDPHRVASWHERILAAEVLALREERDLLRVEITQCELTLVREGILCRGDIE